MEEGELCGSRGSRKYSGFVSVTLLVVLTFGTGALGRQYLESQRADLMSRYRAELLSVADLKARGISAWINGRRGDAVEASSNPFSERGLAEALAGRRKPANRKAILRWMDARRVNQGYEGASLLDANGTILLSTDAPATFPAAPEMQAALSLATRNRAPFITRTFSNGPAGPTYEDILAPLFSSSSARSVMAFAVFSVSLDRQVYPWLRGGGRYRAGPENAS